MRTLSVSTFIASALLASPSAYADLNADFHVSPRPDYRAADKLTTEHEDTAMESDLEEADAIAYQGVENDARKETKTLRKEIAKLEAKIASTKEGAVLARTKSELAQKKADLYRGDYKWIQHKLKKAQKLESEAIAAQVAEEKKLAEVMAESAAVEMQTRNAEAAVQAAHDERARIMARATAVRATIAAAKQRKQELAERAQRMTDENKKMNATVSKAEVRFGGRQPASR